MLLIFLTNNTSHPGFIGTEITATKTYDIVTQDGSLLKVQGRQIKKNTEDKKSVVVDIDGQMFVVFLVKPATVDNDGAVNKEEAEKTPATKPATTPATTKPSTKPRKRHVTAECAKCQKRLAAQREKTEAAQKKEITKVEPPVQAKETPKQVQPKEVPISRSPQKEQPKLVFNGLEVYASKDYRIAMPDDTQLILSGESIFKSADGDEDYLFILYNNLWIKVYQIADLLSPESAIQDVPVPQQHFQPPQPYTATVQHVMTSETHYHPRQAELEYQKVMSSPCQKHGSPGVQQQIMSSPCQKHGSGPQYYKTTETVVTSHDNYYNQYSSPTAELPTTNHHNHPTPTVGHHHHHGSPREYNTGWGSPGAPAPSKPANHHTTQYHGSPGHHHGHHGSPGATNNTQGSPGHYCPHGSPRAVHGSPGNDNQKQQETKKSTEPTTTAENPCAKSNFHFLTWHDGQRTCYCKTKQEREHSSDLSAQTTASTNTYTNDKSQWDNAVPTLETRGEAEFPYFSMIETDKSVRRGRSDRSIVIVPKAKEISVTSETPRVIIGNTPIFSGKYYQIKLKERSVVAPGRHFRASNTHAQEFSVRVNGKRIKVPRKSAPTEVHIDETDMKGANLPVPTGEDLLSIPSEGIPRGYHAVAVIQGFQVEIPRNRVRTSKSRSGNLLIKFEDKIFLVPTTCVKMTKTRASVPTALPPVTTLVGALRSFAAKNRAPPFLRIVIAPSFQLQSKNDPQVFERSCQVLQKS
eukprot:sb/3462389/